MERVESGSHLPIIIAVVAEQTSPVVMSVLTQ
jgi:hypothetical protein